MKNLKIVGLLKNGKELAQKEKEKNILEEKIVSSGNALLKKVQKELSRIDIQINLLNTNGEKIYLSDKNIYYAIVTIEDENKVWFKKEIFFSNPHMIQNFLMVYNNELLPIFNKKENMLILKRKLEKEDDITKSGRRKI